MDIFRQSRNINLNWRIWGLGAILSLVNVQLIKICRHISYIKDLNHYGFSFWDVELGKYYISDGEVSKFTIQSNKGLNNFALPQGSLIL